MDSIPEHAGITTTFLRFSDGTSMTTKPIGTMVYPSAGIPISTGTAWGTSITNNSTNWNTAYGWGNHAGLYRPITWVPSWTDVTGKPNFDALYLPITYIPTWGSITGKPAFATVATTGSYTDLINVPPVQDLKTGIESLDYLPIPGKTTDQINAIVPTTGSGIVKDITLNVYKVYKTGGWVIVITNN